MTSEKWFDWDTSEKPNEGSPEGEPVVQEPANPDPPDTPEEALLSSETFQETVEPLAEDPLAISDGTQELQKLHVPPEPISPVEAARPFHLWITGPLKTFERERLIELLARENFGIREVDLEIQLEAGRILLPRISEFAAVLVAQVLRGAQVDLQMIPSDMAQGDHLPPPSLVLTSSLSTREANLHPADQLPVTRDAFIAGHENAQSIDVIIATGLIREPEWKAESSDSYSEMVEALKKEIKFKAYLKKADGLVKFEAKLLSSPWISQTECRIQVSALAVRFVP